MVHLSLNSRNAIFPALAGLLLTLAIVAAAAERSGDTGRATALASSLRADESGHRAARLLLESLGISDTD